MAFRIALVVATGVAGAAGVGVPQQGIIAPQGITAQGGFTPGIPGQAGPSGLGSRYRADVARTAQTRPERLVTLTFRRATVGDVVDRLSREGVSFVIADEELPRDKRITINIVRQPLSDAMEALGTALGGHWVRKGAIYVFHRGLFEYTIPSQSGKWKFDFHYGNPTHPRPVVPKKDPVSPISPVSPTTPGGSKVKPTAEPLPMTISSLVGFADTLTDEQREKERRQGFLSWDDLTPAQKRMLGPDPIGAGDILHIKGPGEENGLAIGLK